MAGETPLMTQTRLEIFACKIASILSSAESPIIPFVTHTLDESENLGKNTDFDYTRSRRMDRPQTQDLIANVFDSSSFIELR